ncbi:MAG: CoA transferase [SAR202 cluster bacterium]|jgi:crotonobetainyl-CoA:carnitine CoA-transferase CaiB-like acyl-CoA transferase|nr:MAG: CoA transferase [SAR202 cluster bacterium]KAA1306134.1 MAG: CoA transferase [SAR202 cluster bacterium]MED5409050.1 CoA transferase [Chloroflexota bacterium]|tara:strand:+ start:4591 stop:6999 length:2409 start_codon:yes stop_codon:yes gene_type:complete
MAPFSNLKVLDFSADFAGSYCSKLLADFGASVKKIIYEGRGDRSASYGPFIDDFRDSKSSAMFHYMNYNKEVIPVPEGTQLNEKLLLSADLLIEDFSSKDFNFCGLDLEKIRKLNPDILICSLTPFGRETEWVDKPWSDLTIQALTGMCSVNGEQGKAPLKEPGTESEFITGANAFVASVAALINRDVTGVSQGVNVSILKSVLHSYSPYLLAALHTRNPREQQSQGLHFGLIPCKDGYVSLSVRHEPTWEHMWLFFGDPEFSENPKFDTAAKRRINEEELSEILLPILAQYSRKDLLHGLSPLRILVGIANSVSDLLEDEHLKARNAFINYESEGKSWQMPGPPFQMSLTPWKFESSATSEDFQIWEEPLKLTNKTSKSLSALNKPKGPLSGMRGIVLTQAWAGAYSTQLLSDLGMEIIQVESVTRIDPWRGGVPPRLAGLYPNSNPGDNPWDRNALYNGVNRGKKAITLDLSHSEAKEVFMELVSISDVVVENFSGRVISNLGLDYESLRSVNPSVVMVRMPTYGTSGPYSNYPGNGGTTEPVSGMSFLMGYHDGPPVNSGIMHTDAYSGVLACGATITALRERLISGVGQEVDISQQEVSMTLLAEYIMEGSLSGESPGRQGNINRDYAPQGCYLSKDSYWIAISVKTDRQWKSFCDSLMLDSLVTDEDYSTKEFRKMNAVRLDREISKKMGNCIASEVVGKLQAESVPCEVISTLLEAAENDDFYQMGLFEKIFHSESGNFYYPVPPWDFENNPRNAQEPAPTLGEHSEEIFSNLNGWSENEITRFKNLGLTGTDPLT